MIKSLDDFLLQGKKSGLRYATGLVSNVTTFAVSGLTFTPSLVFVKATSNQQVGECDHNGLYVRSSKYLPALSYDVDFKNGGSSFSSYLFSISANGFSIYNSLAVQADIAWVAIE